MVPVRAIRSRLYREMGWELHHPIEMQNHLSHLLRKPGEKHGMKLSRKGRRTGCGQGKIPTCLWQRAGPVMATPLEADLRALLNFGRKSYHWKGTRNARRMAIPQQNCDDLLTGPEDADPLGPRSVCTMGTHVWAVLTSAGIRCFR